MASAGQLEEHDGGGGRYVEGFDGRRHGDAQLVIGPRAGDPAPSAPKARIKQPSKDVS